MFKRIQSDYSTIAKEDYSIVVSSISPIEKAHLNSGVKKFMALFAGYCGAVKSREDPLNTPFEYFNSELIYQVNQKQEAGSNKLIVPAKNSVDLLKIISKNNIPVVLTVEGLNALMGDFLSQNNHFQDIRHKPNELKSYAWDFKNIENELLTNLDSLKNLPYRIFFVSPTHHNWNYIAGQAQYFDKNELGGTMRFIIRYILTPFRRGKRIYANSSGLGIIDTLTLWHRGEGRERFTNLHSYYDCECPEEPTKNGNYYDKQYKFTCRDQNHLFKTSIGEKVFKSLLDKNNPYGKPIYIDISFKQKSS